MTIQLRRRSRSKKDRLVPAAGFALIDLLVAIAVLMVVFAPIAELLSTTLRSTGNDRASAMAQSFAASLLAQVRASAANPSCSYDQAVLALDPTAFWPMNDQPPVDGKQGLLTNMSSAGQSFDATPRNASAANFDVLPGPVACDDTAGGFQLSAPSAVGPGVYATTSVGNPTGSTQFSVAAWIDLENDGNNPRIVADDHTDCTGGGIELVVNNGLSSGFFAVGLEKGTMQPSCGGGAPGEASWNETLSPGWHLYVGTYDGKAVEAYLDGVLVATDTQGIHGQSIQPSSCNCDLTIGMDPQYQGDYTDGVVADVAVWNDTALTAAQVADLYLAATLPPQQFPPTSPSPLPPLWYTGAQGIFAGAGSWCPLGSCSPLVETLGHVRFAAYLTGGWCVFDSADEKWGNGSVPGVNPGSTGGDTSQSGLDVGELASSPGVGYFVAVKVAWGPSSLQANPTKVADISPLKSVVATAMLPLPSALPVGTAVPEAGWTVSDCPLGLS
jgi:Tfp pilus assembly protein PilV